MGVDIVETCNNSGYDFSDSHNTTYEIKADRMSHITNNFFVTYGQKTTANTEFQPAGISKSKADYYVIMYEDSFDKVKTDVTRFLAVSNDYQKQTFANNRKEEVKGVLLKVRDITPYATK